MSEMGAEACRVIGMSALPPIPDVDCRLSTSSFVPLPEVRMALRPRPLPPQEHSALETEGSAALIDRSTKGPLTRRIRILVESDTKGPAGATPVRVGETEAY